MSTALGRTHPIADRLDAWLDGCWEITRTINRGEGRFEGLAQFDRLGDRLRWHEHGELTLAGYQGPASRSLNLVPAAGGSWEVCFEDGRRFHHLDLRTGRCAVEHRCGEDRYAGLYEVIDEDHLEVCWQVTGPGREDEIRSHYERPA